MSGKRQRKDIKFDNTTCVARLVNNIVSVAVTHLNTMHGFRWAFSLTKRYCTCWSVIWPAWPETSNVLWTTAADAYIPAKSRGRVDVSRVWKNWKKTWAPALDLAVRARWHRRARPIDVCHNNATARCCVMTDPVSVAGFGCNRVVSRYWPLADRRDTPTSHAQKLWHARGTRSKRKTRVGAVPINTAVGN